MARPRNSAVSLWSRRGTWHGAFYDEWGKRHSITIGIPNDGTARSRAQAANKLQNMQDAANNRRSSGAPPTRPAPAVVTIYFVRSGDDGPIKIGMAQDAEGRVRDLQTGCPAPLSLLATVPGTADDERRLHARFADLRMHGEWFRPGASLLAFIDEVARNSAA